MLEVGEEPDNATKTGADSGVPHRGRWCGAYTTRGQRAMMVDWPAGHGATARRGDATAAGRSGRRREDLRAAMGTAHRGATARRGGAAA